MFPATTYASKDTPKEKRRRVPSYDKSIQGHPRRKEGEERKERERKREGEKGRGEKRKKASVPSYEQSSRDTPQKESGDPEYSIQESTKKQKKKKGEGEGGGLSSRQVPMNLKLALTALVTLCPAKVAGCFDRCGHGKACANLEFQR